MPTVSKYFFDYLYDYLEQKYNSANSSYITFDDYESTSINDVPKDQIKNSLDKDLKSIQPEPGDPFSFFIWFFCGNPRNVFKSPLNREGFEIFNSFFYNVHNVVHDAYLQSHSISPDQSTHVVKFYSDPTRDDYTVKKKEYKYRELAEKLLELEFLKAVQTVDETKKQIGNAVELTSSLLRVIRDFSNRFVFPTNLTDKYRDELFDLYNVYKKKIIEHINDLCVQLPTEISQEISKGINQQLLTIHETFLIDHQFAIDHERTTADDFRQLILKKDYSRKLFFTGTESELAYFLGKIKVDLKISIKVADLIRHRCLYFKGILIENPENFYRAKSHQIKNDNRAIDDFFKNL